MNVLMIVPDNYSSISGYRMTVIPYKKYIDNLENSKLDLMLVKTRMLSHKEILKYKLEYKRRIKDRKYDAIIGYTINPCYLLLRHFSDRKNDIKYIAFLADSMLLHEKSILPYISFGKRKIKEALRMALYGYKEKYVLNHGDCAIYVSNVDLEFAKKEYNIYSKQLFYLPNGYELPIQSYSRHVNIDKIKIGLMSTFYWDKLEDNVFPFLLEIYPILRKHFPRIELVLAGGGASEETEEFFKNIEGVKYLGYVKTLDEFYSEADIIISVVRKKCGILNRVLEAWAYGKVVIGFKKNFRTFDDAIERIHYISAENAADFIQVFNEIKEGKIDCYNIGNNARELIRDHYTWDICGTRLKNVIEISCRRNVMP